MKDKKVIIYAAIAVVAVVAVIICSHFAKGKNENESENGMSETVETVADYAVPGIQTETEGTRATEPEATVPETTEEITTEKVTEPKTTQPKTTEPKTTEPKTTIPTTTTPVTEAVENSVKDGAQGTTSKGYSIVVKNGITYIGGIMVVNKTYSVPSSYAPGGLVSECSSAFNNMQSAAAAEGLNLYVASGYRSYSLQQSLYSRYCNRDGQAAADRYSARPGHSEHQTGYAIDLNSIAYSFADTAEGKWVAANCYKYGFILRYPQNKESQTGYRYEPWHIRYVGTALAKEIYDSGLCLEEFFGITSIYG